MKIITRKELADDTSLMGAIQEVLGIGAPVEAIQDMLEQVYLPVNGAMCSTPPACLRLIFSSVENPYFAIGYC
jgi:hypothetical protein